MPPEKTLSVWNILSRVIHLQGCQWKMKAKVGTVGGLYLFTWLHDMRIHPASHWHPVEAYYPNISSKLILNSQNPSPVPPLPTQLPRYIPTPPLSASHQKRVTHLHSPLRHLGHDHPPGTENSTAAEIRAAPHASQSQSYSHAMAWQLTHKTWWEKLFQ